MKTCVKCGTKYNKKNGKFCSLKCFAESMKIYKPCPCCGKEFSGSTSVKTCSKKCSYKMRTGSGNPMFRNRKLTASCKVCSKNFTYYRGSSSGQYCSKKCAYISPERTSKMAITKTLSFEGEPDRVIKARIRVSRDYKTWCYQVFKRDNFKCVDCGGKYKIQPHHIIPFSFIYKEAKLLSGLKDLSPFFDIDNGKTLCDHCHRKTDTFFTGKHSIESRLMKSIENKFKEQNTNTDLACFYKSKMELFIDNVKANLV